MSPPAKNRTAASVRTREAYQGIRRLLFHNEIAPGQKISYRDLAERLGMSQTPVIQALKWLEFQQLVRHEPNRGYYTEPVSIEEVAEIYEFRELVELSLLAKTMQRLNADRLHKLESALNTHLKAVADVTIYDRLATDMAFHLTLAELSQCTIQVRALSNLFDLLYLKYGGRILFSTSMTQAGADHRALYERIADGDAKGAAKLLRTHIRRVKDHVLVGLDRMAQEARVSTV